MAVDGILLHQIVTNLACLEESRVNRIHPISKTEVLFQFKTRTDRKNLLISCHSVYNRLTLTEKAYPTPDEPGPFVMLLRKHLEGAVLKSIEQPGLDRWCVAHFEVRNTLGDRDQEDLYIELMGKYANLILVDKSGKILDALKRIPPFENTVRTLQPGAQFTITPPQDKKDMFQATSFDPTRSFDAQFQGVSPLLSREIAYRLEQGESFASIQTLLASSNSIYVAKQKQETVFHLIPLTHLHGLPTGYPLFQGMDMVYYDAEERERVKDITGNIYHVLRRELKHLNQKLPKLEQSYQESLDCDRWKTYGDLLYAYPDQDTKGLSELTLSDFEGNPVLLPIDGKLDTKGNARKCFQKYNKLKKAQVHLQEQIRLCTQERDYLDGISQMMDLASFDDATEIAEELTRLQYLKAKPQKRRKKKKEIPPHFQILELPNGCTLAFGKNNLQNDYCTFHYAKKNWLWLHAKDYHGAHVVLSTLVPDEETLRLACMVAAYYSKGRTSSSVPVNYCPVTEIKRIPKAQPGLVRIGKYKTLYIDPDEATIQQALTYLKKD